MRLRNLMMTVLGLAAVFTACEQEDGVQGLPEITISEKSLTVEEVSSSASIKTISLVASRDWSASSESEWIEVEPASGKASPEPQEVTITLLPNTGLGRTGYVKFDIIYDSKTLTINQNGPLGSAEDAIIYYNDFDKEPATQSFGTSGTSWPYLDQFDGWMNQTGSGADNVEYSFSGISCRNNSNSDGSYSDYAGSGVNNLLFSSKPNFVVKNIALGGKRNLTLSFGTEKYAYGEDDNTFKPEEFNVYVSNDNEKWVKLEYAFPGDFKNGRWDIALSTFTVPEGTENLSIYFASTLSGGHRMDDVKLVISENEGTAIDFSTGTDIPVGGGTGGDTPGSGDNSGAIYYNNFDKAEATKTFGSGSSYPYLDQFDGWMNQTGTGAASVSYLFKGMSARNNSTSNGSYSTDNYKAVASGMNNLFFGTSAYFAVKDIELGGKTNLTISFGTEKYDNANKDAAFDPSELKLYVSADATKWVQVEYTFPNGFQVGKWDLASANITVPAGTEKLSVYVASTVASMHRLDDLKVEESSAAGTSVDFSKGIDLGLGDGGSTDPGDGGSTTPTGDAIFYNNFDKAEATKTFGSGSSYPYLDQFDGWMNQTGTGASSVSYLFKGMSARNNSVSNSDYALDAYKAVASGLNNLFFGTSAYFAVKDIDLGGKTNLTISFGSEKYDGNNKEAAFDPSEFKLYVSADATKWVEVKYAFANAYQAGKWDLASANITVPTGTAKLSVYVSASVASVYRLDDLKVVEAASAGTSIDFSKGVDLGLGDGGSTNPGDGGSTNPGDGGSTGNYQFKKVSSVTSGKSYLIVAAGMAAKPIVADKTYGYLNGDAVTVSGDAISMTSLDNAFVFTSSTDGYTIKGSDNRYIYQTGTYNSFNVSDSPTDGQYWDVTVQSDGTVKILNKSVNKYIQWSAQYKSYGSYADATGEMPVLYELQDGTSSNPGDGGNTNPGDGGNTNPGDGGNTDPGNGSDNTPADAKTVKVVFSEAGIANSTEMTEYPLGDSGVTLTFSIGSASAAPKYYTSGSAVRFYANNTLTVSGKKIYKIVFTYGSSELAKSTTTFSSGSYSDETKTWTGETESLLIKNAAASGHARIAAVEVYYAE